MIYIIFQVDFYHRAFLYLKFLAIY